VDLQRPIHELTAAYRRGETTPGAATEAYLARIEKLDGRIGAYITVTAEEARAAAAAADRRYRDGTPLGPLDGVPLSIKDVFCTRGVRTTCGSRILEQFVPPYDATLVTRLAAAGAVMLGKGNLDEFAMGSSTEHSAFHVTRNPWDPSRVPGGSSGGPAAAVAGGLAAGGFGTDTGGSIRQPAAFCGVVGLKPTYGRISRYGLVAFASSLDHPGPFGRDVTDAALLLGAAAGHDPRDATSIDAPVPDYTADLPRGVRGLRLGVPDEYFIAGMDPEVERAVRAAIEVLKGLGAGVERVSLPATPYALATYYVIAPAEASSNLARYDGVRYGLRAEGGGDLIEMYEATRAQGFGAEVKRRIMLGTYALSSGYYEAYYGQAQKVRTKIAADFSAAFAEFDFVVTPTSPSVAFGLGEKTDDPLAMYLNDFFTVPMSLAGIPAISIPAGLAEPEGGGPRLPVGFQIAAPAFAEQKLLDAAYALEQGIGFDATPSGAPYVPMDGIKRTGSGGEGDG